jgi:hypothetical protein
MRNLPLSNKPAKHPVMEAKMKRQFLMTSLMAGAALTVLGGCASYDGYDRGYRGDAYYGGVYNGGYYDSDYYGPAYYGGGAVLVPRDGYGGGYRRDGQRRDYDRHDGDHRDVRRDANDGSRNFNRGGNDTGRSFNRGDNNANRDVSRNQPQQTVQPAHQAPSSGGFRGGRDGGAPSGGDRSGGDRSGGDRSGGPQGRFGHPGTPNNPLQ